jgi:hypothetical protein
VDQESVDLIGNGQDDEEEADGILEVQNVGSLREADSHGLRPIRRLRRMMPRDQTSLNRGEYEPLLAN